LALPYVLSSQLIHAAAGLRRPRILKLGAKGKTIGTPVTCPACHHANPRINIWCDRCRTPLDWNRPLDAPTSAMPDPKPVVTDARPAPTTMQLAGRSRAFTLPKLTLPAIALPRFRPPALAVPRLRVPRVPRIALVVAAILAVLLIVPLAYVLLPAGRAAVDRQGAGHLPLTNGPTEGATAEAAAIPGVEAKTHLHYTNGTCTSNAPCLTIANETMGKDAAAVVFSTASSATRQCVGYVYRIDGRWHFRDAVCGLPEQLSPLIGHDATVHLPANCANVRNGASLKAHVVACLNGGTTIHIDGGPAYADGRIWWHEKDGWIAHEFLTGP
jgi:hypothetical protein